MAKLNNKKVRIGNPEQYQIFRETVDFMKKYIIRLEENGIFYGFRFVYEQIGNGEQPLSFNQKAYHKAITELRDEGIKLHYVGDYRFESISKDRPIVTESQLRNIIKESIKRILK